MISLGVIIAMAVVGLLFIFAGLILAYVTQHKDSGN